jgi:L-lysine 6-oxidase
MADWSRRKFLTVTSVAAVAATRLTAAEKRKAKKKGPAGPLRYAVHPAVGVARLGNSTDEFYLEPETIGGLPIECTHDGAPIVQDGKPLHTRKFKDAKGRIRRQAAQFRVFAFDANDPSDPGREITLDDPSVESIEWTVHLANKKGVWFNNQEFIGCTYLAGDPNAQTLNANYYYRPDDDNTPGGVPSLRNSDITETADRRQQLIIDPGPRTVKKPGDKGRFSRDSLPLDYPFFSFPEIDADAPRVPYEINTLGEIMMAPGGRLVVLGGYGRAGGEQPIATYTGQDTWFDDISDGPVWCTLKLKGHAEPIKLNAWALVGSPKYAPELRNISTLDDVMFDVGVRFYDLVPDLYAHGVYNPAFRASYERDIEPILERIADYIWVANVPSMVAFTSPRFDTRDASPSNRKNRETFYSYFRDSSGSELSPPHQELFHNGVPMMPLNSGSNSVTNNPNPHGIPTKGQDKYMGLTRTQYFLLGQWAKGLFTTGGYDEWPNSVHPLDRASMGNCVGHPMSPGIETTWTMRNPVIYESPYRIKIHKDEEWYRTHGLSTLGDETGPWYKNYGPKDIKPPDWLVSNDGCEPGDLTKRMSSPWMSDFYQCSVEYVNFSHPPAPNTTATTQIPTPPTFYTYWWPPQAPMHVITGETKAPEQAIAGVPAGFQVYYTRGANNIGNLVVAWKYMGFIVNENTSPEGRDYPYFTEQERNNDRFVPAAVAVGHPINQLSATGSYATPTNYFTLAWYLREEGEIAACNGVPDCNTSSPP